MLRKACLEATGWPRPYKIAVNLSAKQFQDRNLADAVHRILLETGLSPSRLELEITETALFDNLQQALDALRRLRALGVSIAMDDFGTGYSSLSSLQAFPFGQFVEQLGEKKQAAMIVRSVLGLGNSLEIPVLAEGVETAQQLEFLSAEDCGEVQGFYFGRPASAERIRRILASGYAEVQLFTDDPSVPDEAEGKITPITAAKGKGRRPRPSAA